jgi:protein EFR3
MGLLSCCFPVSHEATLLKSCYPPAKQIPATSNTLAQDDSEYKPLSQELSRLTYYATNKPGKLNKLAEELETRVIREVRKAQAGYPRFRM